MFDQAHFEHILVIVFHLLKTDGISLYDINVNIQIYFLEPLHYGTHKTPWLFNLGKYSKLFEELPRPVCLHML